MTDANGVVLISGDIIFITVDLLFMFSVTDDVSAIPFVGEFALAKLAP